MVWLLWLVSMLVRCCDIMMVVVSLCILVVILFIVFFVVMVGGGQLVWMIYQVVIVLGQNFCVLVILVDDFVVQVIFNVVIGLYIDFVVLCCVVVGVDVLIFDYEYVLNELLEKLVVDGVNVVLLLQVLVYVQDKFVMWQCLVVVGVVVFCYVGIKDFDEIDVFVVCVDVLIVVKVVCGGYDGWGVWMVCDVVDVCDFVCECLVDGVVVLVEEWVDLCCELLVLVVCLLFGQGVVWLVVQMV